MNGASVVTLPHGRVPPHNLDAERSLLGGILLEGINQQNPTEATAAAIDAVCGAMSSPDFFRDAHRLVFEAMLSLREDGAPIDRVTVKDELARRGTLETVGGDDFLNLLDQTIPTASSLPYYAKIVHDTAHTRRLIETATGIAQLGYEQHGEAGEFAAEAVRRLTALQDGDTRGVRPVVVRMDSVASEAINWLWRGWMPCGELVMIDGDPGLGKSTLTIDIAARLTRGRPMPGESDIKKPASVLFVAPEDDLGRVLRPRLEAAGADLARVRTFAGHGIDERQLSTPPAIPNDLPFIARLIREENVALVVIDNLFNCFSAQTNSFKDQDVRRALWPITTVAKQTGAVIVAIRHLNKLAGGPALYRGGGSIGIIGAARAGLLVGRDPEDETVRVVASNKSNLAEEPSSLRFKLVSDAGASRVEWLGASTLKAADILATSSDPAERSAQDEACAFLVDLLSGGPVLTAEVQRQARAAGISDRTLQRARSRLGVQPKKQSFSGKWILSLPEEIEEPKPATQTGLAGFGAAGRESSPIGAKSLGVSVTTEDRQHEDRQNALAVFGDGVAGG